MKHVDVMPFIDTIVCGDCLDALKSLPDGSVDLIITSPPYADARKRQYGGIHPDRYVEWFLPRAGELMRLLKPTGTFILNIKERAAGGERHTYVLELILAMRRQGWLWTEEFVWHKKNCYPGKWPNRFRDAWERCLQFNRQKKFNMYQEAVMVPIGNWTKSRLKNLSDTDKKRDESGVQSGFGKNVSNWLARDRAYPTNVLHMAPETANKRHPAAFPLALPEWFVRLFTVPGDVVLDPFCGSGTALVAALMGGRCFVGCDIEPKYVELAINRIDEVRRLSK